MKKQNGFTLIEMMLVIAVVAIMAALGVMAYRRHAVTTRIDKTAIEMQHVLEAALAYNVDQNGKWPEKRFDAACSTTKPEPNSNDFIQNYISNQDVHSSYGSYFCWSPVDDNQSANLFWVALKIPHNDTALGNRIAARLPNAILTSNPEKTDQVACSGSDCYVRAEVVQPAATSNNVSGSGMVVATGDCPSHNDETNSNHESSTCTRNNSYSGKGTEYQIEFAACSDQYMPRVTVFPNQLSFPKDNYPGFTVKDIDAERTSEPCTVTTDDNGKRRQVCNVTVHATTCIGEGPYKCNYIDIANARHPGSVGASYMVACVPKKLD